MRVATWRRRFGLLSCCSSVWQMRGARRASPPPARCPSGELVVLKLSIAVDIRSVGLNITCFLLANSGNDGATCLLWQV